MDIEQIKKDFQELCTLTENFMKKYGEDNVYLVIDKNEIKLMTCGLHKVFETNDK